MSQDQFLMMVRMALQMAGTFLVAHGVFAEADWTTVAGALLTMAPIAWSFWARREAGLKASVGAMPNTVVVETAPTTGATSSPAADVSKTTTLAAKIATLPEVKTVIATPEIAASTVSDKVVSGTHTAPAAP
jgi:hypothetical protein